MKSNKLALINEGKILNLMFLAIYIPVVPFENWLRITPIEIKKKPSECAATLFVPAGSPLIH